LFTPAPLPLVLAYAAATTLFTSAPLPLVLADAAAATFFTAARLPLVLIDAAGATGLCTCSSAAVACAVRYTDVYCPPAPGPPKHIPCLGVVEFGKLFLEN